MSDSTYQPGVYRAQGGNQLVVGPAGSMLIEGVVNGPSTVGQSFFVSSVTGSSGNAGTGFSAPKATLAQALALCTASRGDRVYLLPGHVETIAAAAGIAIATAGVSIIGLGNGSNRPTFTWSATDSTMTITAANVLLKNVVTKTSVDECVSMIAVSAAGVTLDGVDFVETTSAQAIQWLLTTNAADQLTIKNCRHIQGTAAGGAQKWIQLVGTDHTRIIDNTFIILANASTASHLISGSTAVVNCEIARNLILFTGATITIVINLVTGSTGIIADNRLGSGTSVATAAAITGDGCFMFQNYWADTAAASGLLAPGVDTDT
jgi:hypothetical protein